MYKYFTKYANNSFKGMTFDALRHVMMNKRRAEMRMIIQEEDMTLVGMVYIDVMGRNIWGVR